MTSTITPVILCGGSGTRLWPLSRELHPKQFVTFGQSSSLFARTLRRVREIPDIADPLIVCNEEHRFQVRNELRREWDAQASILLEPAPRNTAPAVALAALALLEKDQDSLMLVLPSDHALGDTAAFCKGVLQAAPLAENGSIVTFGITPDGPETGYGYIERGAASAPALRWPVLWKNRIWQQRRPCLRRETFSGTAASSCCAPPSSGKN